MSANYFDKSKPKTTADEILCDGCWKVSKKDDTAGWKFFGFSYLACQNICSECVPDYDENFSKLQERRL